MTVAAIVVYWRCVELITYKSATLLPVDANFHIALLRFRFILEFLVLCSCNRTIVSTIVRRIPSTAAAHVIEIAIAIMSTVDVSELFT